MQWTSVSVSKDGTTIIKKYRPDVPEEKVHEVLEEEYPEYEWDWTVLNGEARIFQNHWRMEETRLLKEGKTYADIWELEAIGKAKRMAEIITKSSGKEAGEEYMRKVEETWANNKKR